MLARAACPESDIKFGQARFAGGLLSEEALHGMYKPSSLCRIACATVGVWKKRTADRKKRERSEVMPSDDETARGLAYRAPPPLLQGVLGSCMTPGGTAPVTAGRHWKGLLLVETPLRDARQPSLAAAASENGNAGGQASHHVLYGGCTTAL